MNILYFNSEFSIQFRTYFNQKTLKSEKNTPWLKSLFDIVAARRMSQCLEYFENITLQFSCMAIQYTPSFFSTFKGLSIFFQMHFSLCIFPSLKSTFIHLIAIKCCAVIYYGKTWNGKKCPFANGKQTLPFDRVMCCLLETVRYCLSLSFDKS